MLIDARQRLADHRSGSKLLSSDELKSLDKKVDIYQRKLDTMQDDLDDREVERILKREQIHNERLHERRQRRSEL
jgi:predicted  nucleic acid-binding Zn-ribbon protein